MEVGSFQSVAPWDGLQSLLMWLSRPFWEGPELPCKLQTQACHKRGLGLHKHCCLWPANKPCGAERVHLVIVLMQTTGPCPKDFRSTKNSPVNYANKFGVSIRRIGNLRSQQWMFLRDAYGATCDLVLCTALQLVKLCRSKNWVTSGSPRTFWGEEF